MIDAGAIAGTIRAAIEALEPEDHEDARRAARRAVRTGLERDALRKRAAALRFEAAELQVERRTVRARRLANRASRMMQEADHLHAACIGALAELSMLGLDAGMVELVRRSAGVGVIRGSE